VRFLIDNALAPLVADGLREHGHDAVHVRDYEMQAAPDVEILACADRENRVLVSADADFGALPTRPWRRTPSMILFRRGTDRRPERQLALLFAHLEAVREPLEGGALMVFEQSRLQVLPLPSGPA
jgi:predicted nuclease of predicted toxin-antitoxin system